METENVVMRSERKSSGKKIVFSCIAILAMTGIAVAVCCLSNKNSGSLTSQEEYKAYSDINKLSDYLYEITYNDTESGFEAAQNYFTKYKVELGGCSSVQNGYIRGRNYDWTYDDDAIFVIHTTAAEGRHASVGVASGLPVLTQTAIENGDDLSEVYSILPYVTVDGINDAGLVANINIVNYGEKGAFVMKTEDTSDDYFPAMVIRTILDKAGTIEEAINLISEMDIYSIGTVEEAHFLISGKKNSTDDTYTTVVVEFIPDEEQHYQLSIIGTEENPFIDNKPIMTNFHLTGFDGTTASLTKHPMGYERYQILSENYNQGTTVAGMEQLMKKVYYTNFYDLYSDRYWYSEDTSGDLTLEQSGEYALGGDISKAGGFSEIAAANHEAYEAGQRDGTLWHTVHTSVYDGKNLTLSLIPQEGGYSFDFKL